MTFDMIYTHTSFRVDSPTVRTHLSDARRLSSHLYQNTNENIISSIELTLLKILTILGCILQQHPTSRVIYYNIQNILKNNIKNIIHLSHITTLMQPAAGTARSVTFKLSIW